MGCIRLKNYIAALVALVGLAVVPTYADAKVIVKKSTKYYTVTGKSGVEIAKGLVSKGPRRTKLSHAIASTGWRYEFGKPKQVVRGRKCKISDITITVHLKYTLPKWKPSKGASKELRTNWKEFSKLVTKHEHKHGAIAEQGAKTIEKAIKGLSGNVSKGCKDFGRNAAGKFKRIALSINRKQVAFDRREKFALSKIARVQRKLIRTK